LQQQEKAPKASVRSVEFIAMFKLSSAESLSISKLLSLRESISEALAAALRLHACASAIRRRTTAPSPRVIGIKVPFSEA
jgi:hypothetical protein